MSGRRRGRVIGEGDGDDEPGRTQVTTTGTAVAPARYLRIQKFSELTGYTQKAVTRKIEDGVWIEGKEYRRAPDGCICVDLEGYYRWVEVGREPASRR